MSKRNREQSDAALRQAVADEEIAREVASTEEATSTNEEPTIAGTESKRELVDPTVIERAASALHQLGDLTSERDLRAGSRETGLMLRARAALAWHNAKYLPEFDALTAEKAAE